MNQYDLQNSKHFLTLTVICLLSFCLPAIYIWEGDAFIRISNVIMGEAFEAYHGALNIIRFGWKWGGLQDMATNPTHEAHNVLYIHHPNFGLYFSYVLHVFGITKIETQNLISGLGTLLGLISGWFLCFRLSKSYLISTVLLIFLSIDFKLIEQWGFNIHRAFEYLSIFMPTLFSLIWLQKETKASFDMAFILTGIALAMGQDYMAYFTLFIILSLLPLCLNKIQKFSIYFRYYCFIYSAFLSFFIFRQMQVIYGAGLEVWKQDFLYQVLNRLHLEHLFRGDWSATTTNFYIEKSVINPGFAPYTDVAVRFESFIISIGNLIMSNFASIIDGNRLLPITIGVSFAILIVINALCGLLSLSQRCKYFISKANYYNSQFGLLLLCIVIGYSSYNSWVNVIGIGYSICLSLLISFIFFIAFYMPTMAFNKKTIFSFKQTSRLINQYNINIFSAILLCATILMYVLFPTYFMLVFPAFLLAPCFISIWKISLVTPILSNWRSLKIGVVSISMLIIIKLIAMGPNILESRLESDHVQLLRQLKHHTVVSNFTPASISSFTHAFSGFLTNEGFETLLKTGEVNPKHYSMIFEKDKSSNMLYRNPSYALFYKSFGSKEQLAKLKSYDPQIIKEGNKYVLFEIQPK